jgi:hypothetical protein
MWAWWSRTPERAETDVAVREDDASTTKQQADHTQRKIATVGMCRERDGRHGGRATTTSRPAGWVRSFCFAVTTARRPAGWPPPCVCARSAADLASVFFSLALHPRLRKGVDREQQDKAKWAALFFPSTRWHSHLVIRMRAYLLVLHSKVMRSGGTLPPAQSRGQTF